MLQLLDFSAEADEHFLKVAIMHFLDSEALHIPCKGGRPRRVVLEELVDQVRELQVRLNFWLDCEQSGNASVFVRLSFRVTRLATSVVSMLCGRAHASYDHFIVGLGLERLIREGTEQA